MTATIHSIHLGLDQVYIIRDEGTVMVDGGIPGKFKVFKRALEKVGMDPRDLQLMIVTHGHWDHVGCASEIKELTGAKIAMHHLDRECLERPLKFMPPGVNAWGVFLEKAATLFLPFVHYPPATVDLLIGDEGMSLEEYGIAGRVIHTPGHSPGSISVLLESGEAFVGDLAMNTFFLRYGPNLPVLAEDLSQVKESWRLLMKEGARTIYPAHGEPFPADVMRAAVF